MAPACYMPSQPAILPESPDQLFGNVALQAPAVNSVIALGGITEDGSDDGFENADSSSSFACCKDDMITNQGVKLTEFSQIMEALESISNQLSTNLTFTKAIYRGTKKSLTGPGNSFTSLYCHRQTSASSDRSSKTSRLSHGASPGKEKEPRYSTERKIFALNCIQEGNLTHSDIANTLCVKEANTLCVKEAPLATAQGEGNSLEAGAICGKQQNQLEPSLTELGSQASVEMSSVLCEYHSLAKRNTVKIWRFMEDRNSSFVALAYFRLRNIVLALSVGLACMEVFSNETSVGTSPEMTYAQLGVEIIFAIELIVRFFACSDRLLFLLSMHSVIDFLSVCPCFLRIYVLVAQEESLGINTLFSIVPVLRLLKVLRHFDTFQLLLNAFFSAAEAMPMLIFIMFLIASAFATVIYYFEPRSSIPSFPLALYLCVITVSTVGYGDFAPVSGVGRICACFLSIIGPMYMAIPIGIIGHAFSVVWEDRHRLLMLHQMRRCVTNAGYSPKELRTMYEFIDQNKDGTIDFDEFVAWLGVMDVNMPSHVVREVFESFDADDEGTIDFQELMIGLFPHSNTRIHVMARRISNYFTDERSSRRSSVKSPSQEDELGDCISA